MKQSINTQNLKALSYSLFNAMQSMCSSDVLLDQLGRIAHADHVNHYWWSRGVGLIGYYNDLFLARGEPK